jgi:hypothetical protein
MPRQKTARRQVQRRKLTSARSLPRPLSHRQLLPKAASRPKRLPRPELQRLNKKCRPRKKRLWQDQAATQAFPHGKLRWKRLQFPLLVQLGALRQPHRRTGQGRPRQRPASTSRVAIKPIAPPAQVLQQWPIAPLALRSKGRPRMNQSHTFQAGRNRAGTKVRASQRPWMTKWSACLRNCLPDDRCAAYSVRQDSKSGNIPQQKPELFHATRRDRLFRAVRGVPELRWKAWRSGGRRGGADL